MLQGCDEVVNLNRDRLLIKNIRIYTETEIISNGYIKLESGKITDIRSMADLHNNSANGFQELEIPENCTVIPGLIDVHIHGVDGADVMDGSKDALERIAAALPREGTTSFLATTMTQSEEAIENALINAGEFIDSQHNDNKAEVLGVHLEGPFVNKKMAGAQPVQFIIDPNLEKFKKWQKLSNNHIKLVTLAPEVEGGTELISHLKETGVIASIGHSDAAYDEVIGAIESGATHATHLFNQMRGLHHREPGVVGAIFLCEELKAELISDGIHISPEIIKLAHRILGSDRIILITDSMRAKCLKNGTYELGGQEVTVQDGKPILTDGRLAGSVLKLGQALKNMMAFTGCTLEEAVQMGSANPAQQLKIFDRKGSIAIGKDADLVILDENYDVFMTFCLGHIAYSRGGTSHEHH